VSVAASAKAYLVGKDGALAPLLQGVQVVYSAPTKDVKRELVYGGQVAGPVELKAFAGGARVKRSETLTLALHIRVYRPNSTSEATDARAVEIGDVIANYIAANWTLGGLTELIRATVDGVELDNWTDDDGSGSILTLAVGLMTMTS
jgi:hypothetical protein